MDVEGVRSHVVLAGEAGGVGLGEDEDVLVAVVDVVVLYVLQGTGIGTPVSLHGQDRLAIVLQRGGGAEATLSSRDLVMMIEQLFVPVLPTVVSKVFLVLKKTTLGYQIPVAS